VRLVAGAETLLGCAAGVAPSLPAALTSAAWRHLAEALKH